MISFKKMTLIKDESRLIADRPVWIFIDDCWMYIEDTLPRLFYTILTEWRNDKHIVGC